MLFRRFISVLIGVQRGIALVSLLMCVVGSHNISAQQQIALDTYAIFQQSCLICHGPDGAYKESLLMEHNALIEKGSVVPGNPDASELYDRLLNTDTAKRMPLGQPQLPAQSINTIRNWILAGAPDWATVATTDGDFISPAEILNTIENHLMSLSSFDREYARYFTMTHLYNAGESGQILQEYRKALYKLVNSLSWGVTVTNPQPIDPQGTIFYIDLRHYEWDVNNAWTQIEAEYPYHISFDAPTQTALKTQLTRLQGEMNADIPSIHVDWFVAQASLPPLYHDLLSLPLTDRELETRLEVDVVRNLTNAPGVYVWRAGTYESGVSNNNRVIERHTSRYGAYWKTYDFAGSVGTQNIFTHPLSFTHDGGEVIFNLPNGLQGYYLVNASGFRLDKAPIYIVSNPAADDPTVRNGISCFSCHTEGMKTFEDLVRSVIESSATPAYDKEQALRLYVQQSEMDALVQEDTDRYRVALEATEGAVNDIEPISRFHAAFQGPVDAAYAAAVVGLETEAFLEKVRENIGLQDIGLLVLDSEYGSIRRDAWTSKFPKVLFALNFPKLVDKSPSPLLDLIPDPNLRAAVEATFRKAGAPITVEAIANLTRLEAGNANISDLTGLEYARNLRILDLSNNNISDISALAGLTSLNELNLSNNNISDIFPLVVNAEHNQMKIKVVGNPLNDTSINTYIPILLGSRSWGLFRSKLFLLAIAPVSVGQTFTLDLTVKDVYDLSGWQLNIAFNPAVLKVISVNEGDFLSTDGRNTFFQGGNINNDAGSITDINGVVIDEGGISGTGTLLSITFEAKASGQGSLQLSKGKLGASNGNQIHHEIIIPPVIVESTYDLNGDGKVNVQDLVLVAQNLGQANPQADVNGDGVVSILDLILAAQAIGNTTASAAPVALNPDLIGAVTTESVDPATIEAWISAGTVGRRWFTCLQTRYRES